MFSLSNDSNSRVTGHTTGGAVMNQTPSEYNLAELGDGLVGKGVLHQGPDSGQPDNYILAPFTVEWMGSEVTLNDALGRFWRLSHWDDREHYVQLNAHELKILYRHWAETYQELDAIHGRPRRSTDLVDRALFYVAARMKYLERFLDITDAELIRLEVERASEQAAADENLVDGDIA